EQSLTQALTLTPAGEAAAFTAALDGGFSNAPISFPPRRGAPFGGLMAALAVTAARQGLGVEGPLKALSAQFLAGARFDELTLEAELLRGGRTTAYARIVARQGERMALAAQATFGRTEDGPALQPLHRAPPPLVDEEQLMPPIFAPWFTRHVEHRFIDGPGLFGQARTPQVRCWMRTVDHQPLDEARLCFLLDAVFPVYFVSLPPPPQISATADLRYDILSSLDGKAEDGWAYFEFDSRAVGDGWAVEDGACWAVDGTPLALARQLRKVVGGPATAYMGRK
ncbi:MAG TPA: thioesterase family protein, partial [Caulobacteraceae bacterium]